LPPLTLLIKPASGNCNLRCKYCFYEDVTDNRKMKSHGMMSEKTLLELVKKALSEAEYSVNFAFQGGEPTLAGIEFYKSFIDYVNKYNFKKLKVYKSIQTNGIVIDDEWASFLAQNDFLVGLSLDGYKEIHDMNRVDALNKGTHSQVVKAAKLFDKYKVDYNILCVVTSGIARHIDKVYSFFKNNNFKFLQFIPCLDPLGEERGKNKYSLTPERYTYFLKTLFDRWYEDILNNNYISIRQFDNYINMLRGNAPESCGMNGICTCYFVVEADGKVYPCDFYVIDKWYIGNIFDNSFEEMRSTDTAKEFVNVSKYVDNKCKNCKWYRLCRGGCRRDREPFADGKPTLNYFCQSYNDFFEYSIQRMMNIAGNMK